MDVCVQFVAEYTPEVIEIETRLEPFIPDFIPAIGLPFDGIQVQYVLLVPRGLESSLHMRSNTTHLNVAFTMQIPRPDGKVDVEIGLQTLKEPSSTSTIAELELLMQSHVATRQRATRARSTTPFVHSIADAAHRPNDIDLWIESVARVQRTKALATVRDTKTANASHHHQTDDEALACDRR